MSRLALGYFYVLEPFLSLCPLFFSLIRVFNILVLDLAEIDELD